MLFHWYQLFLLPCVLTNSARFVHTYNFSYLFSCLFSYFCHRGRKILWPEQDSGNWEKVLFLFILWIFCINMYTSIMFPNPVPSSWLFFFLFHVTLSYIFYFLISMRTNHFWASCTSHLFQMLFSYLPRHTGKAHILQET